ncbi:MAG: hypothetical protein AB7P03_23530 [Kofleriaceae bacterium]
MRTGLRPAETWGRVDPHGTGSGWTAQTLRPKLFVKRRLGITKDSLDVPDGAGRFHLLHHPDSRFTIEAHQSSHRVVYQTARTDLLGLAERGFLEQTRIGKRMYFTGARDLAKRLNP